MAMADTIAAKLKDAFDPAEIDVRDVSYQHAGHAGSRKGGCLHTHLEMRLAAFAGASRVEAHRMVTKVLASELASTVHALQLELSA